MRCPDCNKFASNDTSTPPELDLSFNFDPESLEVYGEARIVLNSECCGSELSEATIDVSEDLTNSVRAQLLMAAEKAELPEDGSVSREALEEAARVYPLDSPELVEMMELADWDDMGEVDVKSITGTTKTRKDGTVKEIRYSPRYWRTEYGFVASFATTGPLSLVVDGVTITITPEIDLTVSGHIPASCMEPMY